MLSITEDLNGHLLGGFIRSSRAAMFSLFAICESLRDFSCACNLIFSANLWSLVIHSDVLASPGRAYISILSYLITLLGFLGEESHMFLVISISNFGELSFYK